MDKKFIANKFEAFYIPFDVCCEFINKLHRHNDSTYTSIWSIGCFHKGKLVGVAQVNTPISRRLNNPYTLEVQRLCTDGTYNACSFLYSKCAQIAKELGYKKIQTYILESENGASLKASGWTCEAHTPIRKSHWLNWKSKNLNKKKTKFPSEGKQRWVKYL